MKEKNEEPFAPKVGNQEFQTLAKESEKWRDFAPNVGNH